MTAVYHNLAGIAAALALGACGAPERPPDASAPAKAGITLSGPPYGDGPVELLIDGASGTDCRWALKARYRTDTAPHTVDLRSTYRDTASGQVVTQSGTSEMFPKTDPGLSRLDGDLVETRIFDWDEPIPCERIEADIRVAACLEGECPRYIAVEGSVPMRLVVTQE